MISSVDTLQDRAREILLRLLERGSKTSAQLREALIKAEIPGEIADAVIARFGEVQLVDDEAYAKRIVAASSKVASRVAVRKKLIDKGFEHTLAAKVVAEISDDQELKSAIELAIKRLSQLQSLEPEVRQRRLVGFLQRRGFSSATVFSAIREAEAAAVKSEF